ncbi:MAG TPA: phosphotransferase family protein [Caulobacteraceae bacterium]|nr:phosphotransferase family protein [Caulobacteraceae bacterium]
MLEEALSKLGLGPVSGLRRLSGGASQETWAFRAGERDLILRRKQQGLTVSGAALGLDQEAALIQAAARQGAPVPPIVQICRPEDGLGEAYVMERVEGETLGRRIVRDEAFAAVRPQLAHRCGEVLAKIHGLPLEGLPDLPVSDAGSELEKYEAIYRGVGDRRPIFEAAFRWLKDRAPKVERPVLVHGDFRNGNVVIHPQRGLAAVLDWELAHLGDPAEDLGWICVNSWRFGGDKPVGGFGAYEDLLTGYGGGIRLERVLYWQALGSLKWGVMCLIMYSAWKSGADPSVERAMIGRRASEAEIDLIALLARAA